MEPGPGKAADGGLSSGTLVGHYEILGPLGRGGMGEVYLARDRNLGREVALKLPDPEQASQPQFKSRFLREARAASSIDHPNVVTIFEVGEDRGLPWIAMELVHGASLRKILGGGKVFSLKETLRHGVSLASALEAAHAHGVLHRDVNPNNVMIGDDGRAMLADFGLARVWAAPGQETDAPTQTTQLTRPGWVCGTPGYMSPEQSQGREVDPRSDLYSLAVVLTEMCSRPGVGDATDASGLARAIVEREAASLPRLSQDLAGEFEATLRRALSHRPDDRQASASELHLALDDLLRRYETLESLQQRPVPLPPSPAWRHRLGHLTLAAAVVGLLSWIAAQEFCGIPPIPPFDEKQATTAVGWEADPALSPDGKLLAYTALHEDHEDVWLLDLVGQAARPFRLVENALANGRPAWLPDGSALLFVSARDGKDAIWKVPRLGGSPVLVVPEATSPAVSRDGSRLAFGRPGPDGAGQRIFVAPLQSPEQAVQITHWDDGLWDHIDPAWSPDGKSICYADFRNLWVVPAAGGPARKLTNENGTDHRPAWSPDGRFVYFASYRSRNSLALWRVPARGGDAQQLTAGSGEATEPSLSADGTLLAYSTARFQPDLVYVDLRTGARQQVSDARVDASPAIAPDGSSVVFTSNRSAGRFDLWLQPLADGRPAGTAYRLTEHPGATSHPTWSPDARFVAYQRVLEEERDIWIVPAGGGPPVAFTAEPGPDIHPSWSPDGGRIAFVCERDGDSHIWVAPVKEGRPDGSAVRITGEPDTTDLAPVWSPDGKTIAYTCGVEGSMEVCVAPVDRSRPPRRLTQNAGAIQVRWDRSSGVLYASGRWGRDLVTLRTIPLDGGASVPVEPAVAFGWGEPYAEFDLDRGTGLLVFTLEERQGDIWILKATKGRF